MECTSCSGFMYKCFENPEVKDCFAFGYIVSGGNRHTQAHSGTLHRILQFSNTALLHNTLTYPNLCTHWAFQNSEE